MCKKVIIKVSYKTQDEQELTIRQAMREVGKQTLKVIIRNYETWWTNDAQYRMVEKVMA